MDFRQTYNYRGYGETAAASHDNSSMLKSVLIDCSERHTSNPYQQHLSLNSSFLEHSP